jgi:hypothetical protein
LKRKHKDNNEGPPPKPECQHLHQAALPIDRDFNVRVNEHARQVAIVESFGKREQ